MVDIEMVWNAVVEKNHENSIEAFQKMENEWLDKPLSADDKKRLAENLNMIRSKGKKASWKTISNALIDAGYSITDKRTSKARFTIISK